jgi:hypothetical protein
MPIPEALLYWERMIVTQSLTIALARVASGERSEKLIKMVTFLERKMQKLESRK